VLRLRRDRINGYPTIADQQGTGLAGPFGIHAYAKQSMAVAPRMFQSLSWLSVISTR